MWYYEQNGNRIGPVDEVTMRGLIANRTISIDTLVWTNGMANWTPLQQTQLAAGLPVPAVMQGKNIFAANYAPRDYAFAARDRCDETVERLRSVRDGRFLYIRNFYPLRPHLQPNAYKDHKPGVIAVRAAEAAGQLDDVQRLLFAPTRAPEELYELAADPWEIRNLAADPAHAATLRQLRSRLDRWMEQTDDHGRTPESESSYDSDMAVYVGRKANPELQKNIALMKQWAREGK